MIENKKSKGINKRKIALVGFILLSTVIFLYKYNVKTSYFGVIEVKDLKQVNKEYIVTVEGDFGEKKSVFNQDDYLQIVEDEETREGNITEIWNRLSENKSFHVLLNSYDNRNQFKLEKVYID
ncbi:hypothetical protein [Halobacillus aidingensis]|uniref:Uncharacterized protein n=1 Tax=Halobacillus aidingensis TaxID=240303 RepID=A0A1H0VTG2_HALAD|nr:hypothetical protein [Halobacillus aidingensis]SDP81740.1 hypothetical protein SAMN05421677_1438 [Halobacillus aidingensis]